MNIDNCFIYYHSELSSQPNIRTTRATQVFRKMAMYWPQCIVLSL